MRRRASATPVTGVTVTGDTLIHSLTTMGDLLSGSRPGRARFSTVTLVYAPEAREGWKEKTRRRPAAPGHAPAGRG